MNNNLKRQAAFLRTLRGSDPAQDVAKALHISESALQAYETGEREPRDEIKVRIAAYYNVAPGVIF